jgi:hypothetical protein
VEQDRALRRDRPRAATHPRPGGDGDTALGYGVGRAPYPLPPWALGAARIFFVVCGCAVCGSAVGFGMGYRRGVDDAATHNGIIRADYRLSGGTIKRAPSTSNGAQLSTRSAWGTDGAIVNSQR